MSGRGRGTGGRKGRARWVPVDQERSWDHADAIQTPESQPSQRRRRDSAGGSSSAEVPIGGTPPTGSGPGDFVDPRLHISIVNGTFHPYRPVSDWIGGCWHLHMHGAWPTYKEFPEATKTLLWTLFQTKFKWSYSDLTTIRSKFEAALSKRIADTWNRCKKKGNMEEIEWIEHGKPGWMAQEIWDGLVDHWTTPQFRARAERMRRNRRRDPNSELQLPLPPAPVTHHSGARPFSENRRRFVDEKKREPTFEELYRMNHFEKKKQWDDPKHLAAWNEYQVKLRQYMQDNGLTTEPSNDICAQIWCALHLERGGRVWGFGNDFEYVRQQAGLPPPRRVGSTNFFNILPLGFNPEEFQRMSNNWLKKLAEDVAAQRFAAAQAAGGYNDPGASGSNPPGAGDDEANEDESEDNEC